ncbi:PilZ domain-containing protein [Pseudomaricurvus sp. HS19]|uniref:PilZ domain-containing protein n=1 Tax=Pseudomaricurvus sp. HS19 TaxID=2692626 RepID=UPI00136E9AFA|nr:PilZ domain-containing protein [Pseudomaricurvus sp. HS19]
MDERRKFERRPSNIRVELWHPSIGKMIGSTQDISDGGASVMIEHPPIPPIGTVVEVRFRRAVGAINNEPVRMQVMHQHRNIVGLMFTPVPIDA